MYVTKSEVVRVFSTIFAHTIVGVSRTAVVLAGVVVHLIPLPQPEALDLVQARRQIIDRTNIPRQDDMLTVWREGDGAVDVLAKDLVLVLLVHVSDERHLVVASTGSNGLVKQLFPLHPPDPGHAPVGRLDLGK